MYPNSQKPTETVDSLRVLKRRIYLWALIAGVLALLVGWIPKFFSGTLTVYEQIIFPVATALCLALLFALWRTARVLLWVEWSLFLVTAISLLSKLQEIMQSPVTALHPDHLAAFADLLYWFPLVYVLAFLMFNSRRQLLIGSLVFFALSVTVGLVHTIPQLLLGETAEFYLLLRFYLANIAYIILLMVGVRLNEQYIRLNTLAETMTHLAHTDVLLQIANRLELEEALAREINRVTRHIQPLSVVLFDIDHFKQVNDVYGHQAGDTVLQETAYLVKSTLRTSDFLGRWGGEEFLVIAPHTDSTQACRLAERIRQAIAENMIYGVGKITASFGVAEYYENESPEVWLKRADEALYFAKQAGRNQVSAASSSVKELQNNL